MALSALRACHGIHVVLAMGDGTLCMVLNVMVRRALSGHVGVPRHAIVAYALGSSYACTFRLTWQYKGSPMPSRSKRLDDQ